MRLREINSPGELAIDTDLIDRFTSKGWQVAGEGQDQMVFHKPGTNSVLKVVGAGSLPRQAEIRRYVNFFRANQRNPHYPRVGPDRELDWKGKKYYAYTQEHLRSLPGDEAVMDYLEYAMGELGHGEEPDLDRVPPGLSVEDIEGLTAAVDHMFESGLGGQYGFDLSNLANIMQRANGQLVIVDPFSGFDDDLDESVIHESQYVYRVDSQEIPDFAQNMQTYYHTDDFSKSGQFAKGSDIPKEYTGKMTGVYAGTELFTALYATGNSNQTRYVAKYSPGQPTVYFDRRDVPRLKANRSHLTVFDARRFKKLPTGEWFSSDPGRPVRQQVISNPFDYISRAGWRIQQVDDLPATLKKLKAAGARYGAEGLGMAEALVHRGHVRDQDPNDRWHVRDDRTRQLRHHKGSVILAGARPRMYQDEPRASYQYTPDARGRRRRGLPAFHWAYIQGRMVNRLPPTLQQGRQLWYKRDQGFVFADTQQPFAHADFVVFNQDGQVMAYDTDQPVPAQGPVVSVEPAQQTVQEVVKMPPTKNSSQGMASWAYDDAQAKGRRSGALRTDVPTEVYDLGDHLRVFVRDDQGPVLYLALEKFLDGFKSGAVAVEPRGRGQNLAVKIYQAASDTYGRPIYSDTTQTDASRIGIWQRLMSTLPRRVVGYDQRTGEDLPLTDTGKGPAVRGNQPIYVQRTAKDQPKPVIGQDRSRTRLLKLLPAQQEVNEVQILAKVKGKGSEPSQIPRYGRPIEPDQETRYLGQQVGRLGRYQLWRDWLGGQLSYHVFDPGSRTVVLTTFGSRYHRNPNSYIIHGLYAAPGNPVKAHQFYRNLILDQGLTLISDRKQSPGGNRVWQRLEAYPDIEVYGFDTKTGEVMNFGAADAEMYAVPPRAAKDRESRYIAKNIRLVATAR